MSGILSIVKEDDSVTNTVARHIERSAGQAVVSANRLEHIAIDSDISLQQWINNPILFDVLVRHGENGRRKFYGHKIILTSCSSVFKATIDPSGPPPAITEMVLERNANEIIAECVLAAAYHPDSVYQLQYDKVSSSSVHIARETSVLKFIDCVS